MAQLSLRYRHDHRFEPHYISNEDVRIHAARVTHTCKECCRTIDKGETYFVESYVFDGDFHTHKTCAHRKVARDWLQAECGGWLYEGVEEDIREHVFSRMYPMSLELNDQSNNELDDEVRS